MPSDLMSSHLSRAEWLGARAMIASLRIGRFTAAATATFIVVLIALLLIPRFGVFAGPEASANDEVRADTLLLVSAVKNAFRAAASAESALALAEIEASVSSAIVDTAVTRAARDSAKAVGLAANKRLDAARIRNADREAQVSAAREQATRQMPPLAMLSAATILALILGFSVSLLMEVSRPTVATVREAEAIARVPAFVVGGGDTRNMDAGGMDPFRMFYLGLTATTARTGSVEIRGDARAVVASVVGRLALAAASDARATLVVDANPELSPVAGYYHAPPEPGFSDAVAGVRLWREVVRAVGVGSSRAIDAVTGGAIRGQLPDSATLAAARIEFTRLCADYDFCITVALSEAAVQQLGALTGVQRVLLCVVRGSTTHAYLTRVATSIRAAGGILDAVAVWDGAIPHLERRNELTSKNPSQKKFTSSKESILRQTNDGDGNH